MLMQPFAHSCRKASTDDVVFAGEASEPERISPWLILGFWSLMLIHVGFMAFGAVSWWDKVRPKRTWAARANNNANASTPKSLACQSSGSHQGLSHRRKPQPSDGRIPQPAV